MSNAAARSIFFLLAVATSVTASAAFTTAAFVDSEKFIFEPECWQSAASGAVTCIKDLPTFFTTIPFHLSSGCCEAIHAIDAKCLKLSLPFLPIPIPQLGDIVDHLTAAYCVKSSPAPAENPTTVFPEFQSGGGDASKKY